MRATSTVVDAAVFVLFVSGAIVTLTLPAAPLPTGSEDAADETADVLATSTATVNYTLAPGPEHARSAVVSFPTQRGPEYRRRARGTIARHLAAATVGNLTVDGTPVTHTHDDLVRNVKSATRNATRSRRHRAQVTAVWEPYDGAPLRGTIRVGPTPPPDATIHAATVTVASGLPATERAARQSAVGGNATAFGDVVAETVVRGLFPPDVTETALLGGYPVEQLVTYRYERLGDLLGARPVKPAVANNVTAANHRLTGALGERFAEDVRSRFESPTAAAETVDVSSVDITVRTWSP